MTPGLVERDREGAALGDPVDAARAGEGRAALIEGPAGIGKSALLGLVRERASGARVLAARCSELEREFAFGAVRQLLEGTLAADRERLLAGAAAPASAVFDTPHGEGGDVSFAALHGLYWVALNFAAWWARGATRRRSPRRSSTPASTGTCGSRPARTGARRRRSALDRLGRHDEAVALVEEELADARRWRAPGTVGPVLQVLGRT